MSSARPTKLRFYCGLCKVACRDENGYKCHLLTDNHINRSLNQTPQTTKTYKVTEKDRKFELAFIDCLIRKHFGATVLAHDIYRELYPNDRQHSIIKTTCWETLGIFIAYLKNNGKIEANKELKGWTVRFSNDRGLEDEEPIKLVEPETRPVKKVRVDKVAEPVLMQPVTLTDQTESVKPTEAIKPVGPSKPIAFSIAKKTSIVPKKVELPQDEELDD